MYNHEKQNHTYEPPYAWTLYARWKCKVQQQKTMSILSILQMLKEEKIKKLKPLLIKSEPDREYTQHIHSDDNLPNIPEDNFMQQREVTDDSYSETISSDSSSEDRIITAEIENITSSMEDIIEDNSYIYKKQMLQT